MVIIVIVNGVCRSGDVRTKSQGWGRRSAPGGSCSGDEGGSAADGLLVVVAGGRALSATGGKACPSSGGGGGGGTLATRQSFRRGYLRERERSGGVISRAGSGISWRRIGLRVERGAGFRSRIRIGCAHCDGRSWLCCVGVSEAERRSMEVGGTIGGTQRRGGNRGRISRSG